MWQRYIILCMWQTKSVISLLRKMFLYGLMVCRYVHSRLLRSAYIDTSEFTFAVVSRWYKNLYVSEIQIRMRLKAFTLTIPVAPTSLNTS